MVAHTMECYLAMNKTRIVKQDRMWGTLKTSELKEHMNTQIQEIKTG